MSDRLDGDDVSTAGLDRLYDLHQQAYELFRLDRYEDAVAVCDEAITAFGRDDSRDVAVKVAEVMSIKCQCLRQAGLEEPLLAAVDALPTRFEPSSGPELRVRVARALRTKAFWLVSVGRGDEAIAITDDLIVRFVEESDPGTLAEIGDSLIGAGSALAWTPRFDESRAQAALLRVVMLWQSLWLGITPTSGERSSASRGGQLSADGQLAESNARHDQHRRRVRLRDTQRTLQLRRRQLGQALRIDEVLISRFRDSAEPAFTRPRSKPRSTAAGVSCSSATPGNRSPRSASSSRGTIRRSLTSPAALATSNSPT